MKSQTKESKLTPPQFSFTITKIAVSQVCQSVGFKATQTSALETFTDIAARYLRALANSAAASANYAGRTQWSLLDIVHALEELNSVQGFRGASNVKLMLFDSSTLIDIMKFVEYTDEIPFAKPIPRHYFLSRKMGSPPCLSSLKEGSGSGSGRLSHIPEWLPAFPVGVGGERGQKEDNEGEKWGLVSSRGGERVVEKEGKMELPERRERVRFRIGEGEV
ncbi:unnamed protein product [Ilex paraguariensis]|uniref:Bromodomain associated domain-containing protein n=1 Tax=Ilex paraguariensis TaxID=185542 RepID=A0ABC8RHK6_9AQUA